MTPWVSLGLAGTISTAASVALALFARLPLPFDGFAVAAGAGVAGGGTLCLLAWMPRRWIWSETERLRLAFQARHNLAGPTAEMALHSIAVAHLRATQLRKSAKNMRSDMTEQVDALADRLDAAAREIFYVPERRRSLANVLGRSELIEEAAAAHAALRRRKHDTTEDLSREKLRAALHALEDAFDATDLLAARGLLQEVEVASEVAETLLKPRRSSPHFQTKGIS